ncbi:cellulose biosynthesis protein BcsQ [Psychromonas aquimarina]|uniref:cellulose biosynthesis protein BcsQ n=1 Tax=Psychromonas aquimarina TaxID=444919 RepID=UPI000417C39D|nr:cellulose biosynthesis protein BcsQ [Psychromonas aquimarina]
MKRILLISLKGGAGSTTVTANLAHSLVQLNKSVAALDCESSNLLKLHLGLPYEAEDGWAKSMLNELSWQDAGFESPSGVTFVPFGQLHCAEISSYQADKERLLRTMLMEFSKVSISEHAEEWQLIHLSPQELHNHIIADFAEQCELLFVVTNPEPLNYSLLKHFLQHNELAKCLLNNNKLKVLINQFQPETSVGRDFLLIMQKELQHLAVSTVLHKDTAVVESAANMTTVAQFAPHSQAAKDYQSLAFWCVSHLASEIENSNVE